MFQSLLMPGNSGGPEHRRPHPHRAGRRGRQPRPQEQSHLPVRPAPEQDNAFALMPDWLKAQMPRIRATEKEKDPIVQAHYFMPVTDWHWFATEFDGDNEFFGWVQGFEFEAGYFYLSEMQEVTNPFGMHMERDLDFQPTPLSVVKQQFNISE